MYAGQLPVLEAKYFEWDLNGSTASGTAAVITHSNKKRPTNQGILIYAVCRKLRMVNITHNLSTVLATDCS